MLLESQKRDDSKPAFVSKFSSMMTFFILIHQLACKAMTGIKKSDKEKQCVSSQPHLPAQGMFQCCFIMLVRAEIFNHVHTDVLNHTMMSFRLNLSHVSVTFNTQDGQNYDSVFSLWFTNPCTSPWSFSDVNNRMWISLPGQNVSRQLKCGEKNKYFFLKMTHYYPINEFLSERLSWKNTSLKRKMFQK